MEKVKISKNNIKFYEYGNEHLHSFCICVYVKAGVLYENKENNGISHFWEHMIFKNINANMKGKMSQSLDRLGAYFNGATYKDLVEFKITGATKNFKKCSDIISRVFSRMIFSDKDLETERKRIKSEIREDDDESTIDYEAGKTVWKGTSLRLPVAGRIKNVNKITREMLADFHEKALTPKNVFVYVTGAYDKEDLKYLIDAVDLCYEKMNADKREGADSLDGKSEAMDEAVYLCPKNFFNRDCNVKIVKSDKNEIRFSFDFDNSKYTLGQVDILYDILFDGECCKLFKKLSDESGIVYSYSSTIEQYGKVGNVNFSYEVGKKNLMLSIKEIVNILMELKKGISDELKLVKPVYADNATTLLDLPERLNWVMAYEGHVLGGGYKNISQRKKAHISVDKVSIDNMANEIFTTNNLCVTIKTTDKKLDKEKIKGILKQL